MTRPKALVLRAAGTNCEDETQRALDMAGADATVWHTRRVLEDPGSISDYQILTFAGGFSYGDDVAAGRVWGLELRTHLREQLKAFVAAGGVVLGVCNGFQVLIESGIFEPDAEPEERSVALYGNASNHYECRWVELASHETACPWIVTGEQFPCPVAHAEGRLVFRDEAAYEAFEARGQIALSYVLPEGANEPGYPADPNGSTRHVAGICDPTGRVLGLMPHPERNLTPWNHPYWTRLGKRDEGEGLLFYRRMVEVAAGAPV